MAHRKKPLLSPANRARLWRGGRGLVLVCLWLLIGVVVLLSILSPTVRSTPLPLLLIPIAILLFATIQRYSTFFIGVLFLLLGSFAGIYGYVRLHGQIDLMALMQDFYANASMEFISIGITIVIVDSLNGIRQYRERKKQLIGELLTWDNGLAQRTFRQIRAEGWHADGSLRGEFLNYTNLERVYLPETDFSNCVMAQANFRGTWLKDVNFTGTRLTGSDFTGAHHLKPRQLMVAERLTGVILPDGSRYNGCLNLPGDFELARRNNVDVQDALAMARFYYVSVDSYLQGQQSGWSNLDTYWEPAAVEEANKEMETAVPQRTMEQARPRMKWFPLFIVVSTGVGLVCGRWLWKR